MPDRLNWLSDFHYERYGGSGDVETWICRDYRSRLDVRVWAELWVTGDAAGRDLVAAGLHDDNLCYVRATIDNIKDADADLRSRLTWYEARVLAMLEPGSDVTNGARPTPREKNPPCPSCGAEPGRRWRSNASSVARTGTRGRRVVSPDPTADQAATGIESSAAE
jgi:hypothetical protein